MTREFEIPVAKSEDTTLEKSTDKGNDHTREQLYAEVRSQVEKMATVGSREDCIRKIKTEIAPFLTDGNRGLLEGLDDALSIQDDEKFMDKVSELLRPIAAIKIDDPKRYESIQQQRILNQHDYVKVNDLFAYGLGETGDYIHLHIFPVKERKDKLGLIKEGMKKLAGSVDANKNIKLVTATSWIVASNPRLMEMLGFEIEGSVDERTRKEHFSDDNRPISKAFITREELLKRYL